MYERQDELRDGEAEAPVTARMRMRVPGDRRREAVASRFARLDDQGRAPADRVASGAVDLVDGDAGRREDA